MNSNVVFKGSLPLVLKRTKVEHSGSQLAVN